MKAYGAEKGIKSHGFQPSKEVEVHRISRLML